jgi:hypothetical protein
MARAAAAVGGVDVSPCGGCRGCVCCGGGGGGDGLVLSATARAILLCFPLTLRAPRLTAGRNGGDGSDGSDAIDGTCAPGLNAMLVVVVVEVLLLLLLLLLLWVVRDLLLR